jgi:hypothetical protein
MLACAMAVAAGCGGSPTAPAPFSSSTLVVAAQTAAFEYLHAPGDTVDVEWQEAYHRWAIEALQVPVPRRIRYNKYTSRSHMGDLTGHYDTNAYADGERFEIHTIWARDNHEVVHLYSSHFGRPVALWSEGLAVAFQVDPVAGVMTPRWSGVALHDHARQFRAQGRLIPLADLATTAGFRRFDANVTYPEAGSFMRFLLDTCGLDGVKRLFASGSPSDDGPGVAAQFASACGRSLADAEQGWLAMLETR